MRDRNVPYEQKVFRKMEHWNRFVRSLGIPKDDYERTRFQARCSGLYRSWAKKLIQNLVSLPLLPMCYGYLRYRAGRDRRSSAQPCDMIWFASSDELAGGWKDIPEELREKYPNCVSLSKPRRLSSLFQGSLDGEFQKCVLVLLKKYPFAFYSNLYVLLHVGWLCSLCRRYQPSVILSLATEFDYSTSLLTHCCEALGMEYIGVMHGEYLCNPRRAFVRYSRYYAWSAEDFSIFTQTGSPREMLRTYSSNRLSTQYQQKDVPSYYITYYLEGEDTKQLKTVRDNLLAFVRQGLWVKVRSHPRSTDGNRLRAVFQNTGIVIECPGEVPLSESFADTQYIVSVKSTVLSEALGSSLTAVIDDCSAYIPYELLQKMGYRNLSRISLRMSQLLANLDRMK